MFRSRQRLSPIEQSIEMRRPRQRTIFFSLVAFFSFVAATLLYWSSQDEATAASLYDTLPVAVTGIASGSSKQGEYWKSYDRYKKSLSQRYKDNDQCRFFLAESALSAFAGWGIFTAIDIEKGQQAQSMEDICIYVADSPNGTPLDTHSWNRDVFFGNFEGDNPRYNFPSWFAFLRRTYIA